MTKIDHEKRNRIERVKRELLDEHRDRFCAGEEGPRLFLETMISMFIEGHLSEDTIALEFYSHYGLKMNAARKLAKKWRERRDESDSEIKTDG